MKERSSRMYCDFWLAAECNMLLINVLFNTVVYIFLSSRVHAIPSSWPSSLDEPHSVLLLRLLLTHGRGYGTTITHLQWGQPLQSGNYMHIDRQAIKNLTTSQVSTLCVISNAVTHTIFILSFTLCKRKWTLFSLRGDVLIIAAKNRGTRWRRSINLLFNLPERMKEIKSAMSWLMTFLIISNLVDYSDNTNCQKH